MYKFREVTNTMAGTDSELEKQGYCKHSPERVACVVREPDFDSCRMCPKAMADRDTLLVTCCLCGLEQPPKGMSTDFRNGNMYCADRVACWGRYDKANGISQ